MNLLVLNKNFGKFSKDDTKYTILLDNYSGIHRSETNLRFAHVEKITNIESTLTGDTGLKRK